MSFKQPSIAIVCGTRPEVTKLAPIILEFKKRKQPLTLISTGQHDQLFKQSLDAFNLKIDYNLKIMNREQTLSEILTKAVTGLDLLYTKIDPALTIVLGDASSTFAASLVSFYRHVPVAHIEAGMRTGRLYEPFPEEANRRLIASITEWFFPATEKARQNLLTEGFPDKKIFMVGSTEVDALNWIITNTKDKAGIGENIDVGKLVVVTTHRRENWGKPLEDVFYAIKHLAMHYSDVTFIHSVHPNPIVYQAAKIIFAQIHNIRLLPHIEFLYFIRLLNRASLIMTDSGGVQVDAAVLRKPILILRNVTEWSEITDNGFGRLVGTNKATIIRNFQDYYRGIWPKGNLNKSIYSSGAAKRIADIILNNIKI